MSTEELMANLGGTKNFITALKLAIWMAEGQEHHLELAYHDDELVVFRRKVLFSEQLELGKKP